MSGPDLDTPYWSQDAASLTAALKSGPGGLSSPRAAAQLGLVGPNSVEEATRLSALRLLLRQFESPLVLILVVAAAISLALQQWVDAAIILAIVLGSCLLSFFQEYRASTAVEELKRRLALMCRVMRDGVEQTVPVSTIVPGDLVVLSAGNLIPADALVIEAQDFLVSEASMTGESFPVEKRPGTIAPDAPIAARTNAVFLGASVRSGTAKVLAVKTGRRTEFGAIAARLRARPPETDFARGVRQFGYLLIRVMVVIVLFVLTVNLLLDRPVIESLLFAVALAVGLSPELLPAIISVTLSAGARAMSKRGVIVRRLDAIENLGSMDILCTDKTGTLTEGAIVLSDVLDAANRPSDEVRRLAFLNAAFETGIENPLDAAIVAAGESAGLTTRGLAKIDEIPYDFMRRRLTIVVAEDDAPSQHLIVTKGAFSNVLDICSSLDRDGAEVPLDAGRRAELEASSRPRAPRASAFWPSPPARSARRSDYDRDDERDMTFRGFLVFYDPPKADARAHDPRPQPARHPHQGDQRRQSPCDGASGGGRWPRRQVDADRRRTRDAQGRGVVAPRATHRSLRRNRSAAEGADRPRPAANRPLGRLSRRRHQRCAGAACGRCRHLGRTGRGCRPRERRHHPAAPRSRRAARRASRTAGGPSPTR